MSHGGKVSTSYNTLGRNSLELISDLPEEHLGIFSGTFIIQVTNKSEGSHRQELLDWLSEETFSDKHRSYSEERVLGTGAWFVDRLEFTTWITRESAEILYCPGLGTCHSVDAL